MTNKVINYFINNVKLFLEIFAIIIFISILFLSGDIIFGLEFLIHCIGISTIFTIIDLYVEGEKDRDKIS